MYLERRRRRWYALHDIPRDAQKSLGRRRFVQSLDTEDHNAAQRRAAVLAVRWRAAIDQARNSAVDPIERDASFWREALKRQLHIPTGPRTIESKSNDVNRVSRTVVEHDGTLTTRQSGVERGDTSSYGAAQRGPFLSMRNEANSRPILMSELKPGSIVRVAANGQEMQLRSAIAAGYIIERPDGSYAAAGTSSYAAEKKDEHPDLESEAFADRKADEAFTEVLSVTSAGTQIAAVNELVAKGEIGPNLMGQLASQMGTEPAAVEARLAPVIAAFHSQADSFISERGLEPEDVYQWARENQPSQLKAAMQSHAMKRTTRGYDSIVQSYVQTLDQHDAAAILSAEFGPGVTARQERGKILIRTPKGEMPWGSAVRAGLIKLGRKG